VRTTLDCIPCAVRQALEATRCASDDDLIRRHVMGEVLTALAAEADLDQSPPQVAQRIHRLVRRLTGDGDPYADLTRRSNSVALGALPRLRTLVDAAADRLAAATRLAIAANTLDAGMNLAALTDAERDGATSEGAANRLARALESSLEEPLHGDVEEFREATSGARGILLLSDNSGEIIVDRLLIEQLPRDRLTIAVRGAAVLNDATLEDAHVAGLDSLAPVIDNGSDAPGTLLADCSQDFLRVFRKAEVIIAKGQGNYESLSDVDADIFFLFKVKCPVVAQHAGLPLDAHALLRSPEGRGPQV